MKNILPTIMMIFFVAILQLSCRQNTLDEVSDIQNNTLDENNGAVVSTLDTSSQPLDETATILPEPASMPLLIVSSFSYGDIYLIDMNSSEYRILHQGGAINFFDFIPNTCELILGNFRNIKESPIYTLNEGETPIAFFDNVNFPIDAAAYFGMEFSPSDSVFILAHGFYEELETIHDAINLYLLSNEDLNFSIQLAQNGGGWAYEWSPDGKFIAYTDYDNEGRHQLFVSNSIGEDRIQLTSFANSELIIQDIEWSPSTGKIAFFYGKMGAGNSYKGEGIGIIEMTTPFSDENVHFFTKLEKRKINSAYSLTWADEHTLIADIDFYVGSDGIYWINIQDMTVRKTLTRKEIENGSGFVLYDNKLFIQIYTGYIVYDLVEEQIIASIDGIEKLDIVSDWGILVKHDDGCNLLSYDN